VQVVDVERALHLELLRKAGEAAGDCEALRPAVGVLIRLRGERVQIGWGLDVSGCGERGRG
jgi:hypothetical protein